MRVAVFSDVQANIQAMETVVEHIQSWRPDLVVMAGDLVNRGPSNLECLIRFDELRRKHGWLPVQGNHEEWILRCWREAPASAVDTQMRRFTDWAAAQIGSEHAPLMNGWPDHMNIHAPDGTWAHITHGSMAGNRMGISQSSTEEDLEKRLPKDIGLFVGGHTHKPHERHYRGTHIVNVGSVGSPFDRDERAAYGQFELRNGRWRTRIVRLPYDRSATDRDFQESGFIDEGGPLARIIYQEWKRADLLIRFWGQRYQNAVLAGDIGLEESVDAFLADLDR